jgi:hypothetical protein
MILGILNVRGPYKAGSLTAAARELANYKLDINGVQLVRWYKGGTVRVGDCNCLYGKGNGYHQLRTGYLYTAK